jgi:hypothetical protein
MMPAQNAVKTLGFTAASTGAFCPPVEPPAARGGAGHRADYDAGRPLCARRLRTIANAAITIAMRTPTMAKELPPLPESPPVTFGAAAW